MSKSRENLKNLAQDKYFVFFKAYGPFSDPFMRKIDGRFVQISVKCRLMEALESVQAENLIGLLMNLNTYH